MQTAIPTSQIANAETDYRFLRRVLLVDALFCAISGIVLVLFAQPIATFVGVNVPGAVLAIGLVLLAVSVFIFITMRARPLSPATVMLIIGGNVAWIVASIALLIADASIL